MRREFVANLLVVVVVAGLLVAASVATSASPRVVMISIDGLRPEVYLDPAGEGLRMPNLVELCGAGACARAMTPVFPSVTYPAHTSLVTGTRPAEHGIVTNFVRGQDWYLNAADIGSPTLWQAARAAGRKTAIVTWPASYGAEVDYLIPENLSFGVPDVRKRIRDGSTRTIASISRVSIRPRRGTPSRGSTASWASCARPSATRAASPRRTF